MTESDAWGSHDALFLAGRVAPASLVFVNHVQSCLRDVEAAMAESDWPTAVEACAAALRSIFLCHRVLAGMEHRGDDGELDMLIALDTGDIVDRLCSLPSSHRADQSAAEAARESMVEAASDLERGLPIHLPVIRTARGYFPTVRIGADLDALRASLGLPPLDWTCWL